MSSDPVLKIKNLSTYFYTRRGVIKAVDRVSFEVEPGKLLGLVGESGCGKSVTALSILRLIEPPGRILSGEVWLNGYDLLKIPPGQLRQVRGREIALVFQDPLTSLNPVLTIGTQLAETIVSHEEVSRAEARRRAVELLFRMGLPDPERLMRLYPFQLSGGMRQRVMMAMAISMRPKVLIADEPTTALDVTVQAQILAELKRLQEEMGMAIILITHDLGVVAAMADEVAVMYAGSIVERGPVAQIFDRPAHPYTRALLRSVPRLGKEELVPIGGQPPTLLNLPAHCAFLPRCPEAHTECRGKKPELREIGPDHAAACHRISRSCPGEAGRR
ncbi:ABC transporter-like [Moorella glycerini]|uniref:Oligopeptide transport ATP-binding protein OppD n=1 Tax=Neomoorella stamsii TaxID=1266720 RepID=A0A9X7P654_9FIRM|nr:MULTISPECIES: ABC transporter ATP-binding protein [Moorella]PRR72767.1 Oligopeptide transport ATP-binding protein OppD [Moorella stamsii]CEP68112.1 ABC transporter-like [Moorella glycerini]